MVCEPCIEPPLGTHILNLQRVDQVYSLVHPLIEPSSKDSSVETMASISFPSLDDVVHYHSAAPVKSACSSRNGVFWSRDDYGL